MLQDPPQSVLITRKRFTRGAPPPPAQAKKKRHRGRNQFTVDLGPYSRAHRFTLANLNPRKPEALIVKKLNQELTEFIGTPNVVQRTIIERCCWLQLRLAMMDVKLARGHQLTEIDSNCYLSWSNALIRTMARLGFEPKRNGKPSLDAILAEADDER
jgi:hypothetical protein